MMRGIGVRRMRELLLLHASAKTLAQRLFHVEFPKRLIEFV